MSRAEYLVTKQKQQVPLVAVQGGAYLLEALLAAGAASSGVAGAIPMTWQEIRAFGEATGRISEPWEHEMIRNMSTAYVSGMNAGADPLSISPLDQLTEGQSDA